MEIKDILKARKKEIEKILEDFGADSRERVEDILEEREDIEVTLRTLKKYKFSSYAMPEKAGFQQAGSCPICMSSADPRYKPYCSNGCQVHDTIC